MSQTLILASCFLPLRGETLTWWTELDRHLQARGCRLVLLSTAPQAEAAFPVIPLPYLLRHFAAWFPATVPKETPPMSQDSWETFLLENDAAWANGAYTSADNQAGLLACQTVARWLLRTLAPGAVLLWNSTHPQTAIFQMECWRQGLPVYAIERGLLPDTLMMDAWGIQGASDAVRHWLAHDLTPRADKDAVLQAAAQYYLSRRPQKYAQAAFGEGGAGLRRQMGLEGRRVVLLLGQGDAAGLHPREARAARQNAPVFADTRRCLMALKKAVASTPGAVLLFKPHPLDATSYAEVLDSSIRWVNEFNVHALIDLADVVAAQFTTLQYETVFYDTPVLLLGRSAWWGRGCTFEVNRLEELPTQLRAALDRKGWTERRQRAQEFLAWALSEYLVGCHAEVPARHKLSDLADFLQRAAWDSRELAPVENRVWLSVEQLAAWSEPAAPEATQSLSLA